jgi:hypothetical protein
MLDELELGLNLDFDLEPLSTRRVGSGLVSCFLFPFSF